MSPKQRSYYFTVLWPQVCLAQGWSDLPSAEREAKRRMVTRDAIHRDSSTGLSQPQITRLFRHLEWLARPNSLKAAKRDANPEQEAIEDTCRRLVWKIRDVAKRDAVRLTDGYIQEIAAWDCREAQVTRWTDLPEASLRRVLIHINQRANEKDPEVKQTGPRGAKPAADKPFVYYLRPGKALAKEAA